MIGSMDDLNKATLDDLKAFFAEFYHPANATLCLAGDFEPAEAKALIQKYFGGSGRRPETEGRGRAAGSGEGREARAVGPRAIAPRLLELADGRGRPSRCAGPRLAGAACWPASETSRLHRELVLEKRLSKDVSGEQLRLGVGRPIRAPEHRGEGGRARGGARRDRVGVSTAAVREVQGQPAHGGRARPRLALFEKQSYARLTSPLLRAVTLATGFAQKNDPRHYQKEFARYYQVTPADLTVSPTRT